jgi:hypothetical protein
VTTDPQFRLAAALEGFEEAQIRFRDDARERAQPEKLFVPLCEALWWTASVDDGLMELSDSSHNYYATPADYQNARDADPNGQIMLGVIYARNRCGHQRAIATTVRLPTPGSPIPMVLGAVFTWLPASQLPPPDPAHPNTALRQVYDTRLAGQPVEASIGAVKRWFDQERARLSL